MKVVVPVAKNTLGPLGITAAASAIKAGIQKNNNKKNKKKKQTNKKKIIKKTWFWNNSFNNFN